MYPSIHFLLSLRWTRPCTRPLFLSFRSLLPNRQDHTVLVIMRDNLRVPRKSLPIVSHPQHRPQVLHLVAPANTHQLHLTLPSHTTATAHQPLDFFLFSEQTKLFLGSEPGLRLNPSPSLVETVLGIRCDKRAQ